MNQYNGDEEKKAEAVQVCIDALEDDDTHLSELAAPRSHYWG